MDKTKPFNLVILRWKKKVEKEYTYHAVATNMEADPQKVVYVYKESVPPRIYVPKSKLKEIKEVPQPCSIVWQYNQRAQMENLIRVLKWGIGMEAMPCQRFKANEMFFAIGVLTYNLWVMYQRQVLENETTSIQSTRWQLVQIPAWIVRHAYQIVLKFATSQEKFAQLIRIFQRIEALQGLPAG